MIIQDRIRIGQKIIMFILVILAIFFITKAYYITKEQIKYNELKNLYSIINDTTFKWKDKYNREHFQVQILTVSNETNFEEIKTKDSIIIALRNLVKTKTNEKKDVDVAMIVYNQTINHLKDSINNIISGHTLKNDTLYPIYTKNYQDSGNWIKGTIILGINKFELTQHIRNHYDFTLGKEIDKKGFLTFGKTYKTYAEIINFNPYTETQIMKVYQRTETKNTTNKTILISGTVGILLGILIHLL